MSNKKNRPVEAKTGQSPVKKEVEILDAVIDGVDNMLNIRSTPEVKEGNIIKTFPKGFKLKVVDPKKEKSDWYRIIIGDPEVKGYAMKKYIKII